MSLLTEGLPKPQAWPPPADPERIGAVLRYARMRDPIGHRVHCALAIAHLFTIPLSTAGSGITFALLVGYAIIRLPNIWRCYTPLLRMRMIWALAAWIAWTAISLIWTADIALGTEELWSLRMALLPPALWPVLEIVPWLIGAALCGVFGQQIAQLLEFLDITNVRPQDGELGRVGGWIHPIQTGAWCVAAMCWHIAATLNGRGRLRWISLIALAAAALGLVATESRGPWISAAVAVPAVLIALSLRRPATRRAAMMVALLAVVAAACAWPLVGQRISTRVQEAFEEYERVQNGADYSTNVGLRIGLWSWAWDMYRDDPIAGIGAGAYRYALDDQPTFVNAILRNPERIGVIARDHPHSTPLHILATTGSVGGVIMLALAGLALHAAWKDRNDHPWADGTLYVLISWFIGAQFDCYNLNGHYLGIFMLAVSITLPCRDALRGQSNVPSCGDSE